MFSEMMISATKLPLNQVMNSDSRRPKEHVIGLDANCMQCANTQNNEATVKAFKMACLSYKPSTVVFENATYTRKQLIRAKETLMAYTLSTLKHLDLGNIE